MVDERQQTNTALIMASDYTSAHTPSQYIGDRFWVKMRRAVCMLDRSTRSATKSKLNLDP